MTREEITEIIGDMVENKKNDLRDEVVKCIIAEIVEKAADELIPVDGEKLKFYLMTDTEIPSVYKRTTELIETFEKIKDVYDIGKNCFDIAGDIAELKLYNNNSTEYNRIIVEITENLLDITSTAVGYIPVIGGLVSLQIDIANSLFKIGSNIILKHVQELNDAIAEIEAILNGTTVEEEKFKMYIESLNPNSKEYKETMEQYNEMQRVMKTVQDFLSVFSTEEQKRQLSNEISNLLSDYETTFSKSEEYYKNKEEFMNEYIKPNKDSIADAQTVRPIDPLVVDLNKNDKYTTALGEGTHFDSENDGFKEKTAWIESGDGLLVRDINKNGVIDSGQELFGDGTLLENGTRAKDGFSALAQFDTNRDNKIDAQDGIFSELGIWVDANGDGITQEGELISLEEMQVKEISLSYADQNLTDENGNMIARESVIVMEDGTEYNMGEIHFEIDKMDVVQSNPVEIDEHIKNTMPELKASGPMLTLQQAMTLDEALVELVEDYMNCDEPLKRRETAEQILAKWTGCEAIAPGSRGSYVDAVHLGVIEKLSGTGFTGVSGQTPNNQAGPILERVYGELVADMEMKLLSQTKLLAFMMSTSAYTDEETGEEKIDYSKVVEKFNGLAEENMQNAHNLLTNYIMYIKKESQLADKFNVEDFREAFKDSKIEAAADIIFTENTIYGTPACEYLFGSAVGDLIYAGDGNDIIYGRAGDDVVYGEAGNDEIYGENGNDSLYGGSGNDVIYGGNGNDVLSGGSGNDILNGGTGSNTYLFQKWSGQDMIQGTSGSSDTISLADRTIEDIAMVVNPDNGKDLLLAGLESDDVITVENYFSESNKYNNLKIEFSDGTVIDKNSIAAWIADNPAIVGEAGTANVLLGSDDKETPDILMGGKYADFLLGNAGNDKLYGWGGSDYMNGGEGNDLLSGGAGDDALYGGAGDDMLIGGTGDDCLYGEAGNDTYIFNEGDGNDIILDYDRSAGNQDTLLIRTDYTNLLFGQSENDLVIDFKNASDSITIQSWFMGDEYKLENIQMNDGYSITSKELDEMLQAGNGEAVSLPDIAEEIQNEALLSADTETGYNSTEAQLNLLVQSMAGLEEEQGMLMEQRDMVNDNNTMASDLWLSQTS